MNRNRRSRKTRVVRWKSTHAKTRQRDRAMLEFMKSQWRNTILQFHRGINRACWGSDPYPMDYGW